MARRWKPGTAERIDDDDEPVGSVIGIELLKQQLGQLAEIKTPQEAEEPILGGSVRAAVIEWLLEIRARKQLEAVKVKPRRTAMLYGPPGCGKTTLAHHLAARLGYPLVIMQTAAVHSKYVAATGENLHAFFAAIASFEDPVVLLLDEFDGIGATRSEGHSNSAAEKDANHTVNVLLTLIESFEGMLIAASNRQDAIDPAIWRRFGMHIDVALPGENERFAIIKRYSEPLAFDDRVLDALCDLTAGASPALLRQVMEGLKRSLVLGPKLKLQVNDLPAMVKRIAAAVAPHQAYTKPPLWNNPGLADALKDLPWPPELPEAAR